MEAFLDARCALGECVLWCERRGRLLWTDVPAATLWMHEPASGRTRSWPMPEPLGAFALTGSDDRLLLGLASGLAFFSFSSGRIQRICTVEAELPSTRIGAGRCDRQGRFVFGMVNEDDDAQATGGFYRLNLDLSLERLPLGPVATASGICFSPDGRRMYFADAATGEIRFADYNPCSAEVGRVRSFVAAGAAPGKSGGATVDAEGYLWSARREAGQVLRFAPDGSIERGIALDAPQPACPAFGGPGLSTLYVSTGRQGMGPDARVAAPLSGAMFRQVVDLRGLPEPRFLHA